MTAGNIGRSSLLLASGTVVSRILGFISAVVLAQTLGTVGQGADAFALANQLPNNIYAIVAGGVLSAVLVPQIVRASQHDDGGARYINKLLTLGLLVFGIVAVVATVCAPLLVSLYAGQGSDAGFDGESLALATAFAWWCLPQILFYAIYALLGEVLNARGVFGPFTWAPVVNNVIAIAGMLALTAAFPAEPGVTPFWNSYHFAEWWTAGPIAVLAGTATLGVAAQSMILFLFLRRAGVHFTPDFRFRGVGLRRASQLAGWTLGMIVLTQIAGLVQTNVASIASADGQPAIAVLRFSWLVFMLPHSVATVSLATAYFTRMSADVRDGRWESLSRDIVESVARIGLFMFLATAGIVTLSVPISAVFSSEPETVVEMATVLAGFAVGLVPFSVVFVMQRIFYALEDTRTPFVVQIVHSGVFIVGALLIGAGNSGHIARELALLTSLVGFIQAGLLVALLRRRLGSVGLRELARHGSRFVIAGIVAVVAGYLTLSAVGFSIDRYMDQHFSFGSMPTTLVILSGVGAVMTAGYSATLLLLRDPHMGAIVSGLRRR
ncbi:MAG: hypothetical protein RIS25_587 [Actinomycetota bacterium]|jgi:putative peptidoglycan lipid II flippase